MLNTLTDGTPVKCCDDFQCSYLATCTKWGPPWEASSPSAKGVQRWWTNVTFVQPQCARQMTTHSIESPSATAIRRPATTGRVRQLP
eukprot:s259_g9.t1